MKSGGTMKKAQKGITTKKGRTTMNITDTSGYSAGKKAGYPAQMISPKTKYSKGDTTNVTVNRNMVKKSIKKAQRGVTIKSKNVDDSGNVTSKGMFAPKPYKMDVDTSGYSEGKKKFSATLRTGQGNGNVNKYKPSKITVKRKDVDKAIGKQKMGGMTKKCKYGCK